MRLFGVLVVCFALLVPAAARAELGVYAGASPHTSPAASPKGDGPISSMPRPVFLGWAIGTNAILTAVDAYTLIKGGKSSRTVEALEFVATTPIFFFGAAALRRAPEDYTLMALTAWSGVLMVKGFVQVLRYGSNVGDGEITPADRAGGADIAPTLLIDEKGEAVAGAVLHGSF